MPRERPGDEVRRIAEDLTRALQVAFDQEARQPGRHAQALRQLANIFGEEASDLMDGFVRPAQSSSTPTTRQAVRDAPRTHGRVTRNNTPGQLPPIPPPRLADAELQPNLRAAQERALGMMPTTKGGRQNDGAPSEGGRVERRQTRVAAKRPRHSHGVAIGSKHNDARHISRKRLRALVDVQL